MQLEIRIDIDNDAFLYEGEISRVLGDIGRKAEKTEGARDWQPVRDVNGNHCGQWRIADR